MPDPGRSAPAFPSLYQVTTRVWRTERSRALGRPTTLDDVPDEALDRIVSLGFATGERPGLATAPPRRRPWRREGRSGTSTRPASPPAPAVNAALIGKLHRCCILAAVPNRVARRPGGLALR